MKKIILIISIILSFAAIVLFFDIGRRDDTEPLNFRECELKGYPILESFPRQCRTSTGKVFAEKEESGMDKSDLIKISEPLPNGIVKSPLHISGFARGYWFFEGSFPVKLLDGDGKEIAAGIAQAEGDWMTTEFVPFETILNFEKPLNGTGKLVFKKENPSDFPQYDDELAMPVIFLDDGNHLF